MRMQSDAAARPEIRAILTCKFGPTVISIYTGGAADARGVGPLKPMHPRPGYGTDAHLSEQALKKSSRFGQTMQREELVHIAQNAAYLGMSPHEILVVLLSTREPTWSDHIPLLDLEWCLMHAFAMPLRGARDIDRWSRFSDRGDWADADIDAHLAPWIAAYLARVGND